jgi:hypothetical protein
VRYGVSRLQGKLAMAFLNGDSETDAGPNQDGVVFWQQP